MEVDMENLKLMGNLL